MHCAHKLPFALIATFAIFFSVILAAGLQASPVMPQAEPEGPMWHGDGDFQKLQPFTRKLLMLDWDGPALRVSRAWENRWAGMTREEMVAAITKELEAQGFPPKRTAKLAEERADQRLSTATTHKAANFGGLDFVVPDLLNAFATSKHFGITDLTGDSYLVRVVNELLIAHGIVTENSIELLFTEAQQPNRSISVHYADSGQLQLRIQGEAFLVALMQQVNGQFRLVRITEQSADLIAADDFAELKVNQQDVVDEWLVPLMNHYGIESELIREGNEAVDRMLIGQLKFLARNKVPEELANILERLDGDEVAVRDAACKELEPRIREWATVLESIVQKGEYSPEVKMRLNTLLSQPEHAKIRSFARRLIEYSIFDSPQYLVRALQKASDEDALLIARRLKTLTGKDFGTDRRAWQNWVSENTRDHPGMPPGQFPKQWESDNPLLADGRLVSIKSTLAKLFDLERDYDGFVKLNRDWAKRHRGTWDERSTGEGLREAIEDIKGGTGRTLVYGWTHIHTRSSDLACAGDVLEDGLAIQFLERTGGMRCCRLFDGPNHALSLTFCGPGNLFDFRQFENGRVRLTCCQGDQLVTWVADNCLDLIKSNPDLQSHWIDPVLDEFGIEIKPNILEELDEEQ